MSGLLTPNAPVHRAQAAPLLSRPCMHLHAHVPLGSRARHPVPRTPAAQRRAAQPAPARPCRRLHVFMRHARIVRLPSSASLRPHRLHRLVASHHPCPYLCRLRTRATCMCSALPARLSCLRVLAMWSQCSPSDTPICFASRVCSPPVHALHPANETTTITQPPLRPLMADHRRCTFHSPPIRAAPHHAFPPFNPQVTVATTNDINGPLSPPSTVHWILLGIVSSVPMKQGDRAVVLPATLPHPHTRCLFLTPSNVWSAAVKRSLWANVRQNTVADRSIYCV
jgi:hypothetical protein